MFNKKRKFFYACVLALGTFLSVFLFWHNVFLTTVLLAVLSFLMLYLEFSRNAIITFVIGFVFGPLSEAMVIYSGAWGYTSPDILGFPFWLPFVWGNAALFFRRLGVYLEDR